MASEAIDIEIQNPEICKSFSKNRYTTNTKQILKEETYRIKRFYRTKHIKYKSKIKQIIS